ncbi:hypothetical protein ABPG77_011179 [Micractinium sp. CCAP 211/92]
MQSAAVRAPGRVRQPQNMGCTFSSQPLERAGAGEANPAPAQGSAAPSLSSGTGLVTAESNVPLTNSASSRDSAWLDSFRAGQDPSPTGPLLAVGAGARSAKSSTAEERFKSALDVLKETLHVPLARISIAEGGARALWFNNGGPGTGDVMVVNDTMKDPRFKTSQFVPWPPLTRFYAAAPLVASDRRVLGSLEVLDSKPRTFPPGALDVLTSFSGMITRDLERDEASERKQKQCVDTALLVRKHTVRALSCFPEPVLLCDVASDDKWPIVWVNDRFARETGVTERSCLFSGFWEVFASVSGGDSRARMAQGIRERQPFVLTVAGGNCECVLLEFRPATAYHLGAALPSLGEEAFGEGLDASMVESLNAPFYFGVVKEAWRQHSGKQERLRLEQAQPRAPSSAPLPPQPPSQNPARTPEQWQGQQQRHPRLHFVSPFSAQPEPATQQQQPSSLAQPPTRQGSAAQALQAVQEEQEEAAEPRRASSAGSSLETRQSVEMHLQGRRGTGGSLRRSIDQQRSAALRQQQGLGPGIPNSAFALHSPPLARPGSLGEPSRDWSVDSPYPGASTPALQPDSATTASTCDERQVSTSEVPETLKGVKLGKMLGRGGFGEVYKGEWRGAEVAVKVIKTCVDPASAELTAPMLEGLLSKNLNHPNIVQTYDFGLKIREAGEIASSGHANMRGGMAYQEVWILQQYCNHGTLADAIERGWLRVGCEQTGPPNLAHILQTALEVSSALLYLHRQDVLHGDLTAANVLLTGVRHRGRTSRTFQCKVADFGLSRFMEAAQLTTATVGTVSHMPMELISSGKLSKAVDVFAFGTLCWEMYMGRRAWAGRCLAQILFARTEAKERLALPDDAPPAFKRLVESCLDEDSSRRPQFNTVVETVSNLLADWEGGGSFA